MTGFEQVKSRELTADARACVQVVMEAGVGNDERAGRPGDSEQKREAILILGRAWDCRVRCQQDPVRVGGAGRNREQKRVDLEHLAF